MKYFDPVHSGRNVRVMPGKPSSSNPCQRTPYVVQMCEDKAVSKTGKLVKPFSPEAHIPLKEYHGYINH